MYIPNQIVTERTVFLLSRTAELRERVETVNGEIQQLDMDLEEHQGLFYSLLYLTFALAFPCLTPEM